MIAIIGAIVLPVTSGDTALRSLRLILADTFHISQDNAVKRILLALPVFAVVILVLIWAKTDPNGFNVIWRYFGWSNQTLSVFTMSVMPQEALRSGCCSRRRSRIIMYSGSAFYMSPLL